PGISGSSMSTRTRSGAAVGSSAASSASDPALRVWNPSAAQIRAACVRNVGLSSTIRMFVMALPHLPQHVAEVRAARLAGGDDEQLGDLELRGISVEEDEHLAHEARRERDV